MTSHEPKTDLPDTIPAGDSGLVFLCVANSARSQIAEGLARSMAPGGTRIASAGSAPSSIHPMAIRVLQEIGIDIAAHRSKGIRDLSLERIGTAITLCAEESCEVPRHLRRLHWPTEDPASVDGSEQERLAAFRRVRDEIRDRIRSLLSAGTNPGEGRDRTD